MFLPPGVAFAWLFLDIFLFLLGLFFLLRLLQFSAGTVCEILVFFLFGLLFGLLRHLDPFSARLPSWFDLILFGFDGCPTRSSTALSTGSRPSGLLLQLPSLLRFARRPSGFLHGLLLLLLLLLHLLHLSLPLVFNDPLLRLRSRTHDHCITFIALVSLILIIQNSYGGSRLIEKVVVDDPLRFRMHPGNLD